ncbi:MAG: polyphosphate polymerase domain-containing protein [Clostridiales bacterium]|nr:polyphosphate polymerase domain-containing protein [Clostridiales bacterium]
MNEVKFVFQRTEMKYLLNPEQFRGMERITEKYMSPDAYGKYTIGNIYFDNDRFELIRNSIEKPVYKEKLRLRCYGVPTDSDAVYLEIKKKFKGVVGKRRMKFTAADAYAYLNYAVAPPDSDTQIFKELDYFISHYKPVPQVYLAYDREAFASDIDTELRITFDHNVRYRTDDLDVRHGDRGKLLLDEDRYLMEIKALGAVPLWLSRALGDMEVFPASFSKIGEVYKKEKLFNGTEEKICLKV